MFRSIAAIAFAIGLCQPTLPKNLRLSYAKTLQSVAKKHNFDPLTGVAIIDHESKWKASAVSKDGEDLGLAQIRARFGTACRGDIDPVNKPSQGCRSYKASLLNGNYAIQAMGRAITAARKYCKKRTGKQALFARWLYVYAGYSRRGVHCGMKKNSNGWHDIKRPEAVADIILKRRQLVRALNKRRK